MVIKKRKGHGTVSKLGIHSGYRSVIEQLKQTYLEARTCKRHRPIPRVAWWGRGRSDGRSGPWPTTWWRSWESPRYLLPPGNRVLICIVLIFSLWILPKLQFSSHQRLSHFCFGDHWSNSPFASRLPHFCFLGKGKYHHMYKSYPSFLDKCTPDFIFSKLTVSLLK